MLKQHRYPIVCTLLLAACLWGNHLLAKRYELVEECVRVLSSDSLETVDDIKSGLAHLTFDVTELYHYPHRPDPKVLRIDFERYSKLELRVLYEPDSELVTEFRLYYFSDYVDPMTGEGAGPRPINILYYLIPSMAALGSWYWIRSNTSSTKRTRRAFRLLLKVLVNLTMVFLLLHSLWFLIHFSIPRHWWLG